MTDNDLRALILELTRKATLKWAKGGGEQRECYIQCMVADGLIDAGFVVDVETKRAQARLWQLIDVADADDGNYRTDLLIWDAGPTGSPYEPGAFRAVVEFKFDPWLIADDLAKTARFVGTAARLHPNLFGFVVAGGEVHENQPEQSKIEIAAVEKQAIGHGPITHRPIDDTIPGRGRVYGTAIGVVVKPAMIERTAA